jgi:hypothetical protein
MRAVNMMVSNVLGEQSLQINLAQDTDYAWVRLCSPTT